MKRRIAALAGLVLGLAGMALAGPAQADTVTRSLVENQGEFLCFADATHSTTDATKVATKSGSVKVSCSFPPGTFPTGQKINVFTFGDCRTADRNGNDIFLNSRFRVTANGAAQMTCN